MFSIVIFGLNRINIFILIRIFLYGLFSVLLSPFLSLAEQRDSLLRVLDSHIENRYSFLKEKELRIDSIRNKLLPNSSLQEQYEIQSHLISEYQSFNCDSALVLIDKNINVANELGDSSWMLESKLRQAFVLSMSGFFTQALEVFEQIKYETLPSNLKVLYCWSSIRYHENLIKYTDNNMFSAKHQAEIQKNRLELLNLLDDQSDMYKKEKAFYLYSNGDYNHSAKMQKELFLNQQFGTHSYGMSAMGLAIVSKELGAMDDFEQYLLLAAITDVQLAVKENESLLTLAIYLHEKGDADRAYNYIHAALDDANFYNSRFRNSVIARIQPIIEATYLAKIEQQGNYLRVFAIFLSIVVLGLVITLYLLFRQNKTISKSRMKLDKINMQLIHVNHSLDEANLVREKYIGYYINQCAVYLDKLDDYRKFVQRKIKSGQLDDLLQFTTSNRTLEKDAQDHYAEFDKSFLEVYPTFVSEFNALLKPDERYVLVKDQLNTELRIFALIRLGINDVNQIAIFLRYSIQTIYNYKSKVRGKATMEGDLFEEKVKKIASFKQDFL